MYEDLSDGVPTPFEDGSLYLFLYWIMISIEHTFYTVKCEFRTFVCMFEGDIIMKNKNLSKTEMEIMKYMWSINGEVMPKEIRSHFSHKHWSKQTVSSFLKRLVASGYLNMRQVTQTKYYYSATMTEEEAYLLPVYDIINNTFDGSYIRFIESLMNHKNSFTVKELDDLQKFIDHKRQKVQHELEIDL